MALLTAVWRPILGFSTILFCGLAISYGLRRLIVRLLKPFEEVVLGILIANIVFGLFFLLSLMVSLSFVGVPIASLIAVLGAAGLAIALALKDFLSNVAASLVLCILRPYKKNDWIESQNFSGRVIKINLLMTLLEGANQDVIFAPNGKLMTQPLVNKTYNSAFCLVLSVSVACSKSLEQVSTLLLDLLKAEDQVHAEPVPLVKIDRSVQSGAVLNVFAYVKSTKIKHVQAQLNKQARILCAENNIETVD